MHFKFELSYDVANQRSEVLVGPETAYDCHKL